jgi:putative ABC transport system permease protein
MLEVATPVLHLQGIAGNVDAGVSRTALAVGVVVDDQNRMRAWNDYDFPSHAAAALTGTARDAAVVGTGLARVLQMCGALELADCRCPAPAAPVAADLPAAVAALAAVRGRRRGPAPRPTRPSQLLAATARGAPNVADLQVVKAERQGVKEVDDVYVGLHLRPGAAPGSATTRRRPPRSSCSSSTPRRSPAAKARLEKLLARAFPGRAVRGLDFASLNPFYGQALAMFATLVGFVALLIGAIVLFTVGNTMSTAVIERTVEIGTLRAMGLRRGASAGCSSARG